MDVAIGENRIATYKVQLVDINGDGAGTTEDGYTVLDVRRRNRVKLMLKFDGLKQEEFTALMSAIDQPEFELTYFDGEFKTVTVYAGDRNFELIKANNERDSRWRLDVDFIEL
ncbi:MAG: hypothetical protein NC299_18620 [Lachnospiraceae bacterium]|nr:hypothetical protein [Lachnospiraceae bacterium]